MNLASLLKYLRLLNVTKDKRYKLRSNGGKFCRRDSCKGLNKKRNEQIYGTQQNSLQIKQAEKYEIKEGFELMGEI